MEAADAKQESSPTNRHDDGPRNDRRHNKFNPLDVASNHDDETDNEVDDSANENPSKRRRNVRVDRGGIGGVETEAGDGKYGTDEGERGTEVGGDTTTDAEEKDESTDSGKEKGGGRREAHQERCEDLGGVSGT